MTVGRRVCVFGSRDEFFERWAHARSWQGARWGEVYTAFRMKVRELLTRLAEDGWVEVQRGKGSHRNFKHPTKPGIVTVAFHGSNIDVPIGTLRKILKTAGLE